MFVPSSRSGRFRRMVLGAAALLLLRTTLAQEGSSPASPENEGARRHFEERIKVEGVGAAELYARATSWLDVAFRFAREVYRRDSPDKGRLAAESFSSFTIAAGLTGNIRHDLALEVMDGGYRYTLDSFGYALDTLDPATGSAARATRELEQIRSTVAEEAESLIRSLKEAMAPPPETDVD